MVMIIYITDIRILLNKNHWYLVGLFGLLTEGKLPIYFWDIF